MSVCVAVLYLLLFVLFPHNVIIFIFQQQVANTIVCDLNEFKMMMMTTDDGDDDYFMYRLKFD